MMTTRGFTTIALAVAAVVVTAAVAITLGPKPISISTNRTGSDNLAGVLQDNAPRGSRNIAAFIHRDGQTTFAGLGADEHTEFEIGSITKTFTAELLTNAVERGDLTLDTTVGDIIDVPGSDVEDVSMEELATHTSGLPRMSHGGWQGFVAALTGANPYEDYSREQLLEDTREASTDGRGEFEYSNFGVALLGQLIAAASGSTYEELLQQEILVPLGMTETYLMTPGAVPDDAPRGLASRGRESAAWEMDAEAPAGAIRSTAHDMAIYANHILSRPLPDYTWIEDDEEYFFHNGGTGGFRSMLILDPATTSAAFAITDTTAPVDDLGRALLKSGHEEAAS